MRDAPWYRLVLDYAFVSIRNGTAWLRAGILRAGILRAGILSLLFVLGLGVGQATQAQFPQKVISTNANDATAVDSADVDGDGDLDILSASRDDDKIAWYENQVGESGADGDGFGAGQVITTSVDAARSVAVGDLDGDGDLDVLSASKNDDKIAWYENTDSVLPVELVSFQARTGESGVRLSWQTASETNNTGFYVQHRAPSRENAQGSSQGSSQSSSQEEWARLGFVEGAGTTSEPQAY